MTLERFLRTARASLPALRIRRIELEKAAADRPSPPSFREALLGGTVAIIAEVKRRSPSAGVISEDLDPVAHARAYAEAGAAAISVLTEGPHFGGVIGDLRAVTEAIPGRPALRKDFIVDEIQIVEARAAGAAAVLLIVKALGPGRLGDLLRIAAELGLDPLVEVHSERELETALSVGADIIGVNSRDLDTLAIDKRTAWDLVRRVPPGCLAIAESGITAAREVVEVAEAGADAVLVGTLLSASPDPGALIRTMVQVPRRGR